MSKNQPLNIILSEHSVSDVKISLDKNTECFAFVSDSGKIKAKALIDQPYRLHEYRIIKVLSGTAVYRINLLDYQLRSDDLIIIPSNSIIEVKEYSENFAVNVIIVKALPTMGLVKMEHLPQKVVIVNIPQSAKEKIESFFALFKILMSDAETSENTLAHLIYAICDDIERAFKCQMELSSNISKVNNLVNNFIELLNQHGITERYVSFYSYKLNVTPNYLNATVKHLTGLTVMDWVNRATIMEAKVLLGNSSMKIQEIAKYLNFNEPTVFIRYFRRHVRQTPLSYRRKYNNQKANVSECKKSN